MLGDCLTNASHLINLYTLPDTPTVFIELARKMFWFFLDAIKLPSMEKKYTFLQKSV